MQQTNIQEMLELEYKSALFSLTTCDPEAVKFVQGRLSAINLLSIKLGFRSPSDSGSFKEIVKVEFKPYEVSS